MNSPPCVELGKPLNPCAVAMHRHLVAGSVPLPSEWWSGWRISQGKLIGPGGILPASEFLQRVAQHFGPIARYWFAPSLLWLGSGSHAVTALCWVGLAASLMVTCNILPRMMLLVCLVCFLSFVSAAREFSGYQSDGMLLEAGFLALFFAPSGWRPGLAADRPPSRARRGAT